MLNGGGGGREGEKSSLRSDGDMLGRLMGR